MGDIRTDLSMSGRFHPSGGTTTAKATLRLRHYEDGGSRQVPDGVAHAICGISGRRLAADAVGHRCRASQESSEASGVIAATSSWVSWMRAAARFSPKCCTLVVPGIGSALVVR